MLGKKYGPSVVLPIMMACFGSMTLLTVAATNFSGMMALRWFLGMVVVTIRFPCANFEHLGMSESAFFPLVIYYLTTFYRRGELARRLAVFYGRSIFLEHICLWNQNPFLTSSPSIYLVV